MGMVSHFCFIGYKKRDETRGRLDSRKGAVALEFAILAIPFFMWMLFIFELSYDLFTQEALDFAVQGAVRQIQTGNAQNLTSGGAFITSDFCSATKGLLECNNVWVRVQTTPTYPAASSSAGNANTSPVDYTSLANGALPMAGNNLDLSQYTSIGGAVAGAPPPVTPPFCNAGPNQAVLISFIYIGPSFISGLLPGVLSEQFAGSNVHATLSTAGFITEPFTTATPPASGAGVVPPAPSC